MLVDSLGVRRFLRFSVYIVIFCLAWGTEEYSFPRLFTFFGFEFFGWSWFVSPLSWPIVLQVMDYSLISHGTRQAEALVQAVSACQAQPTPATV